MVAKGKNHKPAGRRHNRTRARITKVRSSKLHAPRKAPKPEPQPSPPTAHAVPASEQNGFPRHGDAQPAELLPKPAEVSAAPLERERSSYDGDTAIKLYLREIGQVK